MRLCQRRSNNRAFHEFREMADRTMQRINEERNQLTERDERLLLYAETEYAIVNSTYYYYVGLEQQSIDALNAINPEEVQRDTAQYLNYLYNIGAGGIITQGTQQEINQEEFDKLMRCFLTARKGDYPYFAANALEALSEHLMDPTYRRQLIDDNLPAFKFINPLGVEAAVLPGFGGLQIACGQEHHIEGILILPNIGVDCALVHRSNNSRRNQVLSTKQ